MKNSEKLSDIVRQWKKITYVTAVVLLVSVIGLFVMAGISKNREIAYNEVSVSVQEVNEVYVHRRHNSGRKLEVKVEYQGNSYTLYGVTMDDRQKYKEALDSDAKLIVYEYKNELFSDVKALKGSTATNILALMFWGLCQLFGVSLIMSIVSLIINRHKLQKALAEEKDA